MKRTEHSRLKRLFQNNEKWALGMLHRDPEFFQRLAQQQAPDFLWIGCSDSRVPANEITGLMPGEVFVHRNIANIVAHNDRNCLSAIQYAVNVLHITQIMVVGHYGCGGVKAALDGTTQMDVLDQWLSPIREIASSHDGLLQALDEQSRWNRLCELNVIEQVRALSDTSIVQNAWTEGRELSLHGWIYAIQDGRLRDLNVTVSSQDENHTTRRKS